MSDISDAELDRDWKPNGRRPQSTIARSFSAELMDIFRIENSVADLDSQVDQRRQTVGKSNDELASLEARIKEMEDRLRQSREKHTRPSISQITDPKDQKDTDSKARSRPGTARPTQQAPSSGNMPPTPGASEDGDRE